MLGEVLPRAQWSEKILAGARIGLADHQESRHAPAAALVAGGFQQGATETLPAVVRMHTAAELDLLPVAVERAETRERTVLVREKDIARTCVPGAQPFDLHLQVEPLMLIAYRDEVAHLGAFGIGQRAPVSDLPLRSRHAGFP